LAARELRPHVTAVRAEVPPVIDGWVDDAVWQQADLIDDLRQIVPVEDGVPSQRTEVRILYDPDFLYLGIRCWDSEPDKIVARRMTRDDAGLQYDARVNISLDPLHDERNGYMFQVSAAGGRRDALIENSGLPKFDWDGIWYGRAQIDEHGFSVEIALPFKTLNVDPNQTTWGFQIFRGIARSTEWSQWASPYQNISFFNMAKIGYLHGLEGIDQGLGLDVVLNGAVLRHDDGATGRTFSKGDPGFDLFYRLTPSLSASLTANTDFGDTEVDERQVNISRFGLFFPEKRRFFLKDFGIFDFADLEQNGRPFFSRRIGLLETGDEVDIRAGGKVTGRVGRFNVGLLGVKTAELHELDAQNLAVGRVSMNIFERSNIGVIFTRGDPNSNDTASLFGADLNLKSTRLIPERELAGNLWFQQSSSRGVEGDEYAFGGKLEYPNDVWNLKATYLELQPNFRPALGFANRVDIRQYNGSIRHRLRPQGWLRTVDNEVQVEWITDTANEALSGRITVRPFWIENNAGDRFEISAFRRREVLFEPFEIMPGQIIPEGDYHWIVFLTRLATSDTRKLSLELIYNIGTFYDGEGTRVSGKVGWRPSRHWLLSGEFVQDRIDLDLAIDSDDDFTVRIARLRVVWQYDPDISFNLLAQWDNQSDEIGIQGRFRWIVEPGQEVILVLNQDILVDEDDRLHRGLTEPRFKVSWLFRF
jgi:hypothetical protein